MDEKLRVKPILLGWVVMFIGGTAAAIAVTVYTTGGDLAEMQKFAEGVGISTRLGMALFGAFFAMVGGYVTAKLSPHDPGRHTRRLGLVVVILGVVGLVVEAATQGIGAHTLIGVLSVAANYGAVLVGGYVGTDEPAAD